MTKRKIGLVIGVGEFGLHIAKKLSSEGCDVIAVDIDEQRINSIKDFVMQAVIADVSQERCLEDLIPEEFDFIVLSVGNIEKSMIATLFLKEYCKDQSKFYVKAITEEHEKILKLLGVTNIIFPERDIAQRIANTLLTNNLLDYIPLSDEYSIAEVEPVPEIIGLTLKDGGFRKKYHLSIIAIQRKDTNKLIFTPGPGYKIVSGDMLMVLGKKEIIEKYNAKNK